jgi:hypothetical protein
LKKLLWFGVLLGTALLVGAGDFQPVNTDGNNDSTQPIGPVSDSNPSDVLPRPDIVTAAVPEPSTLSLLAGGGVLGTWLFLRRRR